MFTFGKETKATMAIIYANSRSMTGPYKPPKFIVVGEEEGSPFRRVFRSKGMAERFKSRMQDRPYIRQLFVIALPKG